MESNLAWVFLWVFIGVCFVLAISPFVVKRGSSYGGHSVVQRPDGNACLKSVPDAPPYFPGDKIQFMNGESKLTSGTVREVRNDRGDRGQQRVTIKYFENPEKPNSGLHVTTTSSRKVILIERPKDKDKEN